VGIKSIKFDARGVVATYNTSRYDYYKNLCRKRTLCNRRNSDNLNPNLRSLGNKASKFLTDYITRGPL
jgi:hypothetical protein